MGPCSTKKSATGGSRSSSCRRTAADDDADARSSVEPRPRRAGSSARSNAASRTVDRPATGRSPSATSSNAGSPTCCPAGAGSRRSRPSRTTDGQPATPCEGSGRRRLNELTPGGRRGTARAPRRPGHGPQQRDAGPIGACDGAQACAASRHRGPQRRRTGRDAHGRREPRSGRSLTPEQARQLLDTAKGDRLEGLVTVGVMLGLRPGELCGLRWEDVDLEDGRPRRRASPEAHHRRRGPRDARPRRARRRASPVERSSSPSPSSRRSVPTSSATRRSERPLGIGGRTSTSSSRRTSARR